MEVTLLISQYVQANNKGDVVINDWPLKVTNFNQYMVGMP